MAITKSTLLLAASLGLCSLTSAAAVPADGYEVESHRHQAPREYGSAVSHHRRKHSAILSSILGPSLYWGGNFTVAGSGVQPLLIDTGSSDCILNKGLYKKSSHYEPYGNGTFTITYEGVNRQGFGFETINGTESKDLVSAGGLTVTDQPQGQAVSWKYFDVPQLPYANQFNGIIGFADRSQSALEPKADSWFFSLCANKAISVCKLGLLFGTSGKGLTVIGKHAKKYLDGELVVVPGPGYTTQADVTLDNKIILKNQSMIMDVGTDNIQGPYEETKKILEGLGYPTHELSGPNLFDPKSGPVKVITGDFKCDKPPTLGFSFPAEAYLKKGQKATIFNVSPKVWDVYDHGHNNCTSILGGTNAIPGQWLLGQSFFAGHYIEYDITKNTVGYGNLKNPSDPAKHSGGWS